MEIDSPPPLWLKSPQRNQQLGIATGLACIYLLLSLCLFVFVFIFIFIFIFVFVFVFVIVSLSLPLSYFTVENSLQSPLSGPKTPSNAVAKVVEKTPVQPPLPQAHGYCDSDTPSASSMVSPSLLVTSPPMGPSQLTGSVSAPITPILAPALLASSSSPSKSSPVSSLRGPVSSVASTPGKSPLRSCHTNNANDNGNGNNNNNNDTVHHLRRLTTATFPGTPQVRMKLKLKFVLLTVPIIHL